MKGFGKGFNVFLIGFLRSIWKRFWGWHFDGLCTLIGFGMVLDGFVMVRGLK